MSKVMKLKTNITSNSANEQKLELMDINKKKYKKNHLDVVLFVN